jgi:serralysin
VNDDPVYAIWDAGGADDWLDLSGDTNPLGVRLDLREGAFSSTHGITNNIAIAYGSRIENAVGTDRGDEIRGNALSNDLRSGGSGFDAASYRNAEAGVRANLANAAVYTGDAAGDSYAFIQNLIGSTHDDRLIGGAGSNVIDGLDGSDTMRGRGGNDTLRGDGGDDNLRGNQGRDNLQGGDGNDRLRGNQRQDILRGEDGDDRVIGGAGDNRIGASVSNRYPQTARDHRVPAVQSWC